MQTRRWPESSRVRPGVRAMADETNAQLRKLVEVQKSEIQRLAADRDKLLSVCEILHVRLFREQGGKETSEWKSAVEILHDVIAKVKVK
jgi:hypothetical protein